MDRKIMFILAVLAIATAGIILTADDSDAAAEGEVGYQFTVGDLTYKVTKAASGTDPAEVMVIDYKSFCTDVDIPAEVKGYSVTSIGEFAFEYNTNITSMSIPSSVTSIDEYSTYGCLSLRYISVNPENQHYSTDSYGVLYNKDVTELIKCPGGLRGEYVMPSSVTSIYRFGFVDCVSLESLIISSGMTVIGNGAFSGCSSLRSVTMPSGITSVGDEAFSRCVSLASMTLPSGLTSIGWRAFSECSSLKSLTIPSGVTSISGYAFIECTALTSVTLPSGITSINHCVFSDCSSLHSVTIPSGVTNIEIDAFSGCTALTYIIVDESNKDYSSESSGVLFNKDKTELILCPEGFEGEYIISSHITTIGEGAFSECTSMTSVTIPSSVGSIGRSSFYGCTSIVSLNIPSGVTSIGAFAFQDCTSLTSITVAESNKNYSSDASGVLFNKDKTELICCPAGFEGGYIIPSGITHIDNFAFLECTSLTSVTIPSSVTSIGDSAFARCASLTSVTIPSGVTSICNFIFAGCNSLTSVTIPSGVTSIGSSAFLGCTSLISVTIPSSVSTIGWNAFTWCSSLTSVTIPSGVTSIGDTAFQGCTSLTSITVAESNENYSSDASGVLFNKDKTELLQCPGGLEGEYTIPSTVTSIESEAFLGCIRLTKVFIPSSVTAIGWDAFSGCTALTSITVDEANENYSSDEFGILFNDDKTQLHQCPGGFKGDYAVSSDILLVDIAFKDCASLTGIKLPHSIRILMDSSFHYPFYSHDGLSQITLLQGYGFVLDEKEKKYVVDSLETRLIFDDDSVIEFVKYGTALKDLDFNKDGFVLDRFYSDAKHEVPISPDTTIIEPGMTFYCTWKAADSPADVDLDKNNDMLLIAGVVTFIGVLLLIVAILVKRRN